MSQYLIGNYRIMMARLNLYLYSKETDIPVDSFNVNSKKIGVFPWQVIKITSGNTCSKTIKGVRFNSKFFFRAVKA